MDRLIYTALTGMTARARAQAVTANNLANAATTGFRRELVAAEGRYFTGSTVSSRVQSGAPSLATPHDPGRVTVTGRKLDIALDDNAWLAVQGPLVKGVQTEAYTRRGDLQVSAGGVLQNGDGRAVLGSNGTPVTVPAGTDLEIAKDGMLLARTGDITTPIGRLKLVNGNTLGTLDKDSDGMFTKADPLPFDAAAQLTGGALEAANLQTVDALAELVAQSRGFEVNARLLGIAKDIDERTARLMAFDR
ncbi:MAG: flagellar hook-basal body complex protein [Polymorphobacter sp.]